jgi:hypothetical protein|nr:MAG TPA: hypothetical protein [Bacteriophage sp.]
MTVKEVMTGITPSADYAGLEMADDFVLAFKTADTQKSVGDYIVCQECITEHSAAVNPGTQDKQYIRKGNATIKTSAQRTFSISGDRTHGDAWQDWVTSLAVMFGTGSAVIVPYVYFSMLTGKGETGKASVIVNGDASNGAGNNAGISVTVSGVEKPKEYTYSAA